ncbi:hypothetical protein JOF56_011214 [Kibdelosporangium banguiense]|uniref:Uncharacterized protein n=1 Tax=Kibdelosporangium banguiense TaxID=1365924 RepID=A0ABS4U2E6_9PSEU|nr:hypothetical protein [Kibdelosporangium banguiense]MBP2330829.1 hypothetical protein [Kibdelosporangium banguiense]
MTDTPIYDQLRLELSSRRSVPDSPPKPRAQTERAPAKPVAPAKPAVKPVVADTETRKPVSVWTLVNANRKN